TIAKAEARRDQYFPQAEATSDFAAVLQRSDIDILDITTHPRERHGMIEAALKAGKHVLSQKPFVLDLDAGEHLADLADRQGVKLAVNQNGRWAPHLSYMREAVRAGLIGDLISCHAAIHWNHGWIKGTPFEAIDDLVFYDFAIHWFDFLTSLIGDRATSVFAQRGRAAGQEVSPPLLAAALVRFDQGQASLIFDGATPHGPLDRTYVAGTKGSLTSVGPNLGEQTVSLSTEAGVATPVLAGSWFNDGFDGAMGELICAIEDGREPLNGARGNLASLALAFAAIASAHRGVPIGPGDVRRLDAAGAAQPGS
ncbi:MAG: Gfo/Idh/MocA family protein, partial [Parvibaculaceae bacterium]